MDEHVIVKNPLAVAFVAMLQWIVPALIAVGSLYFLIAFYDVDLNRQSQYHVMAALIAMLWMLLANPTRTNGRIHSSSVPLLFGVLMRWMGLLAILLAVGYATKSSDQFSRRVVLTWAATTPALLLLLEIFFHEVMHRLLSVPSNARSAVFVGCTEASVALAKEFRAVPTCACRSPASSTIEVERLNTRRVSSPRKTLRTHGIRGEPRCG
jgi:hypothetical protein